MIYKDF